MSYCRRKYHWYLTLLCENKIEKILGFLLSDKTTNLMLYCMLITLSSLCKNNATHHILVLNCSIVNNNNVGHRVFLSVILVIFERWHKLTYIMFSNVFVNEYHSVLSNYILKSLANWLNDDDT